MTDSREKAASAARQRSGLKRGLQRTHTANPQHASIWHDRSDMKKDYVLDCGWGRLLFGQTFNDPIKLIKAMQNEALERRDIAFYVDDPHVLLAQAPQEIFLDPSHTYRLDLATYRPARKIPKGFFIRRLTSLSDAQEVNRIYTVRNMVPVDPSFFWTNRDARAISYFVAEDEASGSILGTVTGVDHKRAFGDPELGSSLWCLAVDPQARHPGIGEALVRRLAEHFSARGAAYMDLSVLHDNSEAISLYERLGFRRVPYFSVKRKNPINENLFTGHEVSDGLNPYAGIIVKEARRRGIFVEVVDAENGFFNLSYGGRTVRCRESLSELTTAVAMSICDDKAVTRRIVARAGVKVPSQMEVTENGEDVQAFLKKHAKVVVKPARGEQGRGVSIGLATDEEVSEAIEAAKRFSETVLIEECLPGEDLRVIVINYKVVAAAVRRPPYVTGDGERTVQDLIERQSRRRQAATDGESKIPIDAQTRACVRESGHDLDSVLPAGTEIMVRRAANLHTGGTIHDVTDLLHPELANAAVSAARAIGIPVTGIDLMVKSPSTREYGFVEANERPGLANHEPQPTAERFVDLLFPLSIPTSVRHASMRQQQSADS